MAPKNKAQKMSINDFLADQSLGSWADEMDDLGPGFETRPAFDGPRPGLDPATSGGDFMDRESRFMRPELPLPTSPPFTAHIGNLSFDAASEDIEQLFGDCSVTSVRVVEDKLTGAPKGFGYVEFATQEGLKTALTYHGANLAGRSIRVSIAEPPKERPGFRGDERDSSHRGIAAEVSNWRSAPRAATADPALTGPLPEERGFERKPAAAEVQNWRAAPRPPVADPALAGNAPEPRPRRQFTESKFHDFDRSRPSPPQDVTEMDPSRVSKTSDPARGEAPATRPPQPLSAAVLDKNWRAGPRTPPQAPSETSTLSQPPAAAPFHRPIQRATPTTDVPPPEETPNTSTTSRRDPFGGAKPVDTVSRSEELERRLQRLDIKQSEQKQQAQTTEKPVEKSSEKPSEKPVIERTAPKKSQEGSDEHAQGGKNFDILQKLNDEGELEGADGTTQANKLDVSGEPVSTGTTQNASETSQDQQIRSSSARRRPPSNNWRANRASKEPPKERNSSPFDKDWRATARSNESSRRPPRGRGGGSNRKASQPQAPPSAEAPSAEPIRDDDGFTTVSSKRRGRA